MSISPARLEAFRILLRVESQGAYSSELIATSSDSLERKDHSLMTSIVLGTLRLRPCIDFLLSEFTSKPLNKLDIEVLSALRMAVFQIFELDSIPSFAAVNDSVELVKKFRKRSATGFVNAVLRKVVKRNKTEPTLNRNGLFSGALFDRWTRQYGSSEAKELMLSFSRAPNRSFRFTEKFRSIDQDKQAKIRASLGKLIESSLVPGCFRPVVQSTEVIELRKQGYVYFQDESSQFVGYLASSLGGAKFWDVCAAPGGKTGMIAPSFEFSLATEIHPKRASLLKTLTQKQGAQTNIVASDGRTPPIDIKFDLVLVDAPCSGTGTIGANPEIRYRFSEETLDSLRLKQRELLESASQHLIKAGFLLFSTCSLEFEEGERVILNFLEAHPEFIRHDGFPDFGLSDGEMRILPRNGDREGFFVALLRRV